MKLSTLAGYLLAILGALAMPQPEMLTDIFINVDSILLLMIAIAVFSGVAGYVARDLLKGK